MNSNTAQNATRQENPQASSVGNQATQHHTSSQLTSAKSAFKGQDLVNKSARIMNRNHLPLTLGAIGVVALVYYYPRLSRPRAESLHAANVVTTASTSALRDLEDQTRRVRGEIAEIKRKQHELQQKQ